MRLLRLLMYDDLMQRNERPILGFKVKSQLSAWATSTAVCTEGFRRKVLQLSAKLWGIEEIYS